MFIVDLWTRFRYFRIICLKDVNKMKSSLCVFDLLEF